MKVLHTTSSKSEADALVAYLAEASIDAAVVGHFDAVFRMWSQFDVILRTEKDLERAEAAVKEFKASPATLSEDLDERSVADLSTLDPRLAPPCPACGVILALDGSLERCPACGTEVDVGALIVDRHGPEVMIAPAEPIECPACAYPSVGLPRPEGGAPICPECGSPIVARRAQ